MNNILHSLSQLDYLVFVSILLITASLIAYNKWKFSKQQTILEYMVMGRSLTLPFFIITLVSTWYGGIFTVTEISFKHGIYNFITQGIFWYLSAIIFALFFAKKACNQQAFTFPDIIGKMYGPKAKKITAVLLMIKVLPIPYVISIGLCLEGILNIPLPAAIILGTLAVALYCSTGGMRAIVHSDIAQFILMFLSITVVVGFSYYTFGGYNYLQAKLPPSHFTFTGNHNFSTVLLWLIVALNSTLLSPVFYQRCFATKFPDTAKKGIVISVFFWFICDICTTLGGMYAKAYFPDANPAGAYFQYAIEILPAGFKGFFIASILITVFSALDSYLFIASTILSHDLATNRLQDKKYTRKASVFITAIASIIIAIQFKGNLESAWIFFESFFLAALFFPLIFGYFQKGQCTEKTFTVPITLAIIAFISWEISGFSIIIESFFIALGISLLTMIILKTQIFSKKHFNP